jgi:hypothetical protein
MGGGAYGDAWVRRRARTTPLTHAGHARLDNSDFPAEKARNVEASRWPHALPAATDSTDSNIVAPNLDMHTGERRFMPTCHRDELASPTDNQCTSGGLSSPPSGLPAQLPLGPSSARRAGTPMIVVGTQANPRPSTRAPHARVPTLPSRPDKDGRPYGLGRQGELRP